MSFLPYLIFALSRIVSFFTPVSAARMSFRSNVRTRICSTMSPLCLVSRSQHSGLSPSEVEVGFQPTQGYRHLSSRRQTTRLV